MNLTFVMILIFVILFGLSLIVVWIGREALETYRDYFQNEADVKLSELFLFVDPKKLFLVNVIFLVCLPLVVYLLSQSTVKAVLVIATIAFFPRYLYQYLYRKRIEKFELALPDALSQISGSIRAGGTLPNAVEQFVMETKGPISDEFALMLKAYRVGVSIDQALEEMNDRVPNESLKMVVSAANIARDVGGNLAEIFERLAQTLRLKQSMEGKIKALTAQGKLQGWVVGFLPLGMIMVLYKMEPEVMEYLTKGLLGWCFLAVIIVMEIAGFFMIKKIVDIDI